MALPDYSSGVLVVRDEIFIAWGITQFLTDLARRALAIARLAERARKDGVLVVTVGRV